MLFDILLNAYKNTKILLTLPHNVRKGPHRFDNVCLSNINVEVGLQHFHFFDV